MESKYIIITGATGGIGSDLVKVCLDNDSGMKGCLFYRDQEKLEKRFNGYNITGLDTYLYQMDQIKKINLPTLIEKHSNIDMIVLVLNSFTIEPIKRIINQEINEIINNINSNIISQLNIVTETLKYAQSKKIKTRIINIDSGAAYHAIDGWSLYSSAKSYINMYLKSLALEENMDIVTYDPGVVDTNMQAIIRNQDKEEYSFVQRFDDYYTNNILRKPYDVAKNIHERYILDWKATEFKERYQ